MNYYWQAFTLLFFFISVILSYFILSKEISRKKKENELGQKILEKQGEIEKLNQEIERKKEEAEILAKEIILKAKEESHEILSNVKKEIDEERKELKRFSDRLEKEQAEIEEKASLVEEEKANLEQKKVLLEKLEAEILEKKNQILFELERISGLKKEDARREILEIVEKEEKEAIASKIRILQEEYREKEKELATEVIGNAIQRYVPTFVAENTVSTVTLASDDLKGRIIGREGRNIKAIEEATGVDILIDDTPGSIVISCFEPIRREIARVAIEKLIKDGRIQPARIEEAVNEAKDEIGKIIKQKGEEALEQVGLPRMDSRLVKLLGRLYFRTSYGQNVLAHSVECAEIAAMLAEELRVNKDLAKKAALFHDIGKAVDREIEGTHVEIGVKIAVKYGFEEEVVRAIESHHGDRKPESLLDVIVISSDAISSSKPGARRDTLENYIKRLEGLESIANSHPGVKKSYAIQAGREIRVFVEPEEVDDAGALILASQIAKEIEENLVYPGQIKVNVVRETRFVEYAR